MPTGRTPSQSRLQNIKPEPTAAGLLWRKRTAAMAQVDTNAAEMRVAGQYRDASSFNHQLVNTPAIVLPNVGDETGPCPSCEQQMVVTVRIQDSIIVECPNCNLKERRP